MSQCKSCTICASADKPIEEFTGTLPFETSFHRMDSQKTKCNFGLQGVCCKLCANGPCRITPKAPKGVCGATADVIVTRNFLRSVAAGSGCYIHIVENAARNLLAAAEAGDELKGKASLDRLAELLGVEGDTDHEKAAAIAKAVLADIHRPEYEPMELVEKVGYAPRVKRWKELGIMPGGAKGEVFKAVVKTSTNLNSDPVDMLVNCLRLGVSTGTYGLMLTNLLNDVLLGQPEIRVAPVGLRVIDPDYINVMVIGHQHTLFVDLEEALVSPEATKRAEAAGAKGFHLIGCTCVGQDLQLRGANYAEVFPGHAGNNYISEQIISTGGIDAIVTEFNCALPGIEPICDELKVKQICFDDVAKKANAEYAPFDYAGRAELSEKVIADALEAYTARRGEVEMRLLPDHGSAGSLTGVSEGTLKAFLGGSWQPLIDLIVSGDIKGIAGVVGCSNLTAGGHDVLTVELTKELIKRDIIVLTAGCSSGGIENVGLMEPEAAKLAGPKLRAVCEKLGIPPVLNFGPCLAIGRLEIVATEIAATLGVDLPQLPLVLSAPQWLEEQALADGCFGLALGLPLHLGLPPFVLGSPVTVKVLTEDMVDLTGGKVIINGDAVESADILEKIVEEKRAGLGL